MFGHATITIPKCGPCPESTHEGLSDEEAMSVGRAAARTLSDDDGFVVVVLESGLRRLIGYDTANNAVIIGHLDRAHRSADSSLSDETMWIDI